MKIFARFYILIHYILNKSGFRLKGLGVVQRFLKHTFIFKAFGRRFWYDPDIEGSYDYLLIGKPNEPETHLFLDKLLKHPSQFNFVDVGASVGEFVTGVSRYKNIQNIYAFEPRPECAIVLNRSAQLNREDRIKIFEFAVDDKGTGEISIHLNTGGTSSGFYSIPDRKGGRSIMAKTITLDNALPHTLHNTVVLIDVEGAEPLVIKGAAGFIKENKPLIIFEYNHISKRHFSLEDLVGILGTDYNIYRLRDDGNLDGDFSNSWNCIAVPSDTLFESLIRSSIK